MDPISGSDVLINGGTKVQDGWHDDVYTGLRLDDDDPLKLQYNLCRDDKCTDLYNDCCAYSGWDDDGDNEQTCAGDYTAVAKSGRTCCLVWMITAVVDIFAFSSSVYNSQDIAMQVGSLATISQATATEAL